MLQLIVPALFQTDDYLDMLGMPRLSRLGMLLVRGRTEALDSSSLEELLCRNLGIARQQDWPVSPISLAAAGGVPGKDYWLRADPVHVRIERDKLILNEAVDPTPDEAALLCDSLAAHFGNEFSPQPLRSSAWIVRSTSRPELVTTPLSLAAGKHIDAVLPTGTDAMKWRKLLNEVQMLLFHHPVNEAREQRGEPAINSVWLWGGGCLPDMTEKINRTVYCNHEDWRALAQFAGAKVQALPDKWNPGIPDNALLVIDEVHRLLRQGDLQGWLQAMHNLENNWVRPLMASRRPFQIDDPLQGESLLWRKAYRWKFWHRPKKPAAQAFKFQAPPDDPGVDAFGNRY